MITTVLKEHLCNENSASDSVVFISNNKELKSIKINNHIFNLPKPVMIDLEELNSMKTEKAILYLICKALFEEETNEN